MPKKLWFKNKSYGWGWTPASWQGWAVLAGYIGFFFLIFRKIDVATSSEKDAFVQVFLPLIVLTTLLLVICYKTGEKPEWRWGKKK